MQTSAQANPSSTYSAWLIIESWARFSLQSVNINQRKADSDHREDNADGAKYRLCWYDVRNPSRDIQGIDGGI